MPSKVQQIPRAFLAALGAIGTGRNPDVLPETLQSTIEASQFYLPRPEPIVLTTAGATAIGAQAAVTVPDGQYWWVRNLSIQMTAIAGTEVCQGSVGLQWVTGTNTWFRQLQATATQAGQQFRDGVGLDLLIPSSTTLLAVLNAATGGTGVTLRLSAIINRIQAV